MVDSRRGGRPVSRRGLVHSRRMYFRCARRPPRAFGGTGQRFWPRIRFPRRHCFLWCRPRPNGLSDCVNRFSAPRLALCFCYLVCGALRLARYNCVSAAGGAGDGKAFTGFPIPAAAGLIASITLFMLWWLGERDHLIGTWKWVLPPLMIFLSILMFSRLSYPSFKAITWRTTRSLPRFAAIILIMFFTALNYEWMPAVLFLISLLYGFLRPWGSKRWRREIEGEIGEEAGDEGVTVNS